MLLPCPAIAIIICFTAPNPVVIEGTSGLVVETTVAVFATGVPVTFLIIMHVTMDELACASMILKSVSVPSLIFHHA